MEPLDLIINEFLKRFYIIYIIFGLSILLMVVTFIMVRLKQTNTKIIETSTSYNEKTCPQCGGKLIQKNGKYGAFMGCSSYPRCKHTASID
ncbi:topoisomerase DNA-binding C4 zinc finger domain-containing protein [Desulfuribacillus alkaliarsenatis]|uniref:DNA topoisomerase type IA zn finger domain-containing protein n=1 Tax=Desulfuribacillus alkaliarsenatis TaxID=766136 RepID=A0A1E5G0P9_9FIRM|nr:hypothetical protein BHF68_09425 [Desulfuribacillus alkaliarsenatis]